MINTLRGQVSTHPHDVSSSQADSSYGNIGLTYKDFFLRRFFSTLNGGFRFFGRQNIYQTRTIFIFLWEKSNREISGYLRNVSLLDFFREKLDCDLVGGRSNKQNNNNEQRAARRLLEK